MRNSNENQINHLEHLVVTLQRRLRILETQHARFGSHVPEHIVLEQEDVTQQLDQTLAKLEQLRTNSHTHSVTGIPTSDRPTSDQLASITALEKRSIVFRHIVKECSIVVWISIISVIYSRSKGWTSQSWDSVLIAMLILFLLLFLSWFFSPVTNNSPKYRKFRRSYLQHLTYRHRDLDMKGLSTQTAYNLEQERVFVNLGLISQPPGRISSSLIPQQKEDLLIRDIVILEALQDRSNASRKFAIIGAPGSGKTTLLKHIALHFSDDSYRNPTRWLWQRTPILLFLRDHADQIRWNPEISLPQLIYRSLKSWNQLPPNGWFETELHNHRCIVLFDGLDEVADLQTRKQVAAWVEHQMQTYANNSFVITSRPLGYQSNPLRGVHVLQVRPFTGEQVRQFVENWYHATEVMRSQKTDEGVRMRASEGARDLLRRLSNAPALTELAANPLLLTMIATIHLYRSSLPGRRVELYAEICEVFLGKRRQVLDLDLDLAPMQKQRILEPLAYHMMVLKKREISIQEALQYIEEPLARISIHLPGVDFLKMIEESSGLLLERESGVYSFAHQTFQEYLAAVHIDKQQITAELITHIENSWWHETTRLYAARADASDIIAACIQKEKPSITALTLAIECMNEAGSVQPAVRSHVEKLLLKEVEDPEPERRRIVAEALIMQRLRRLVRLNERRFIDPGLVTNAEYQLFIDEQHVYGLYYQPDHWSELHFPIGAGHTPVSGIRPSDVEAFCSWLTERDHGGKYLMPLAEEGEVYTKETNSKFGYWVSRLQGFDCEGIEGSDLTPIRMAIAYRIASDLINLQIYALIHFLTLVHQQARDLVNSRQRERDLVDENKQTQSIDDTLVLIEKILKALIGTLDHASAQDLTRTLTNAQDLVRQSATDLAIALHEAHASASAQGQEPVLASAENIDRARMNAQRSDRARASALAGMSRLVSTLTTLIPAITTLRSALTDDFVQNNELMQYFDLTHIQAQKLFRSLAETSDALRANLLLRTRAHVFMPNVERFQALVRNQAFVLDHSHAEECIHVFDRRVMRNSNQHTNTSSQRAYLRYWALLNALIIITPAAQHKGAQRGQNDAHRQRNQITICYGLYLDFAILEERIAGNAIPVEGIRIVKELPVGPDAH